MPAFRAGELKTIIDSTYNLSEAHEALGRLSQNITIGKIVLMNDL